MSFGDEVSVEIKPRLEDMDFIATPMDIDVVYEDDIFWSSINRQDWLFIRLPDIGTTRFERSLAYNSILEHFPVRVLSIVSTATLRV
ncbi:MAG: hypothetical protein ACLR2C_01450 [Parasutterella excrementihominis]